MALTEVFKAPCACRGNAGHVRATTVQIGKMTIRFQYAMQAISHRVSVLFVASVPMLGLALTLVAVLAGMLGAWRLGADAGWTSGFFIASGLLSRYQLWVAVAISAQACAFILNRWLPNDNVDLPVPDP